MTRGIVVREKLSLNSSRNTGTAGENVSFIQICVAQTDFSGEFDFSLRLEEAGFDFLIKPGFPIVYIAQSEDAQNYATFICDLPIAADADSQRLLR